MASFICSYLQKIEKEKLEKLARKVCSSLSFSFLFQIFAYAVAFVFCKCGTVVNRRNNHQTTINFNIFFFE